MGIPLDSDWNELSARLEEDMTDAGKWKTVVTPQVAKGGVFAPADIKLIKDALVFNVKHNGSITVEEERQTVNLLHRLGRIC